MEPCFCICRTKLHCSGIGDCPHHFQSLFHSISNEYGDSFLNSPVDNCRLAIVITDGESRYPDLTQESAQRLHDEMITVVAVGVKVTYTVISVLKVGVNTRTSSLHTQPDIFDHFYIKHLPSTIYIIDRL